MSDCGAMRTAIVQILDGRPSAVPDAEVRSHMGLCSDCREYAPRVAVEIVSMNRALAESLTEDAAFRVANRLVEKLKRTPPDGMV